MANPLLKIFKSPSAQAKLLRLKVVLWGLALDFWKDEPIRWAFLPQKSAAPAAPRPQAATSEPSHQHPDPHHAAHVPQTPQPWFADRVQIMEKMWGDGFHLPGNHHYVEALVSPLGMNKDMSVLDLAAGLGGMARKIAEDFGSYVTGMEPDQTLASRGMIMSIAAGKSKQASIMAYDPATFTAARKYDCIFARELFYRVIGKEKFFTTVAASLKSGGGQIVFTDYLLDSVSREKPVIVQWLAKERNAAPLSLPEMVKSWKGMGFDLRIAEDQTELYKTEILKGLKALAQFMAMNIPDKDTKPLVMREIDYWGRRMEALQNGLKYYRFFAIKY